MLIALPAAVALGFFIRPVASLSFLPLYATADIRTFLDIVWLAVEPRTLTWIWPGFLIFGTLFFTFCLAMPFIETHFRVGRMSIKKPFSLMNHYFLPALKIVFIVGAVFALYFAVLLSLTALQHLMISGAGVPNTASVIVTCVLALFMFCLLCWLCSPFMFMAPVMQIYGYSFADAFTSSVSYYGNKPFKVTFGFAFVFFIAALVRGVAAALGAFIPQWGQIIISIVLHLFLLVYFCAYCMVVTFGVTGMERKDIKKYGV